nr:glutamate dehydrogenase, mitochondrial-like isoform X2 [Onthophagus taurus]
MLTALTALKTVLPNLNNINLIKTRTLYTVPERYRNAFYLANASLFDYTNWYIHKAYESCFKTVLNTVFTSYPNMTDNKAKLKVLDIINLLEPCSGVVDISFPIKKTDGTYEVVQGYRAIHALNLYEMPNLGGMRICSDLSKDHIRAFSILATYKHACFGIDMAGSHGGLKISGYDYDSSDLKNIVVTYGKELAKRGFLGHKVDVLEPDLYCTSNEMEWISNTFAKTETAGIACAVGKTPENGGIEMYDEAFGLGVMYALNLFMENKEVLNKLSWEGDLRGKTFLVQGLGKIGSQIARMLTRAGAMCIGVKEHDSYILMEDGVPIDSLIKYKEDTGSIMEYNKYAKPGTTEQIFTEQCDILVLSATHRSIQCHVAERIKAKIIIEAAYSSLTPTAYKVLVARNCLVLPDIFTGAGFSVASYLEYIKNVNNSPLNALVSRVLNLAITSQKQILTDEEYLRKTIEIFV